ncbi:MAG: hypothetical protein H6923_09610, partial [Alphaproteobacteria bacterium]|nr:hypothetical protein [Alphaproteobacteria bacterium]
RPAMRLYAPDKQARFEIAAAEAALGLNDLASAESHLRDLAKLDNDTRLKLKAERLWGALLAQSGRPEAALERYQAVIDSGYVPEATRAEFAKIETMRAMDAMSREDEIEGLETLRYRWRGDDLELAVLHKLGKAYLAADNPRAGLETLRFAVANFSGKADVRDISKDMADEFERLFLEGAADKLTPVQALALFYDFRELTPIGRRGDDMIRRMADRLVEVDLLPQAAELLKHQVEHRLTGVGRAQVATRLALVYLMDRRPEDALRIVNATRQTLLPESLNRQRRLIEARALASLKRHDHALEVIADDGRPEARNLRADIMWDAQDWPHEAAANEEIVGERWKDAGPLDEEDRRRVLRSAIGYSLANDADSLARLRQHFSGLMSQSPDAKAFEIVTAKIDTQGIAFRELARQLASVTLFETFMQDLKAEYESAPGTGTN